MDSRDLRIGTVAEMAGAVTRSHLADGRVVGWFGGQASVVDAELSAQPVPPALAAKYGTQDFWGRWTRTECAAKRADVPLSLWLAEHGLDGSSAAVTTELDGVTVSVLGPTIRPCDAAHPDEGVTSATAATYAFRVIE